MKVYDTWWPWRVGRIIKRTKTRTYVKWADGEVWNYDKAHTKFLAKDSAEQALAALDKEQKE